MLAYGRQTIEDDDIAAVAEALLLRFPDHRSAGSRRSNKAFAETVGVVTPSPAL